MRFTIRIALAAMPVALFVDIAQPQGCQPPGTAGRVLVTGGEAPGQSQAYPDPKFTGEIFCPPYLCHESGRPTIDNAFGVASAISFGSSFNLQVTAQEGTIDRVVLLRPAALTHAFDNDQRYIELMHSGSGTPGISTTISVTAPADDLGPQGYYMVFVLERMLDGTVVPSIGQFIKLV